MRASGPRSSEVGPPNRPLLIACLACAAIGVGVPVAAAARSDRAAPAPAAAPAKATKPAKGEPGRRTAARRGKAGGGRPQRGGSAGKAGGSAGRGHLGTSKARTRNGGGKLQMGKTAAGGGTSRHAGSSGTTSSTKVRRPATETKKPAPAAATPATPAPATAASNMSGSTLRARAASAGVPGGLAPLAAGGVSAGGTFGALAPALGAAVTGGGSAATGAGSDATGAGSDATGAGSDPAGDGERSRRAPETVTRTVVRTVRDAVEVVPGFLWALIAGLGALSLVATAASSFLAGRARRLGRQREALLQDVGLLQAALLPEPPAQIEKGAAASVAYRPATSGPPGGDFYDVFALVAGRVSATGRRALGVTALIRHILRAYLEGGLQPRNALQVGAEVLERHLGPDYACATVAVYDRATSRLTYAGAGMPAPIVLGSAAFEPVTTSAAPPIGMGVPTGTRQTTVLLPAGAAACLYTDGLIDARVDGGRYGYRRAWHALETLDGDASADALLDRVAAEADTSVDDVAAVLLRVDRNVPANGGDRRLEELELGRRELDGERPGLFLRDCGVPTSMIPETVEELRETATRLGGAVLRVRYGAGVPEAETGLRTMEILSAVAGPSGG
jgi:hypothetical protein